MTSAQSSPPASASQPPEKPAPSPGRIYLSTDDLPAHERLAFWHESHGRQLCNVGIKADHEMPFRASANILPLGDCAVFGLTTARARYYVAKDYLPKAPEMTAIVFVQSGQIHGRQRDRDATIGSGQAFAILSNEVGSIDVMQPGSYLNIYLPTAMLAAAVPDLSTILMRPINENPASLQLLAGYAATLHDMKTTVSPSLSATISAQLTELAAHLFSDRTQFPSPREGRLVRAARRQAIKTDIAAHLTQHELSSAEVALRLGITPRYMRKILRDEGTTFSDLVRHMRLQQAHRLLTDTRLPISTIAYEIGFGDLSHFNRCFREKFGATPRDIRDGALQLRLVDGINLPVI